MKAQYSFNADEGIVFEYEDVIKSELYDWPNTLLTYPVVFNGNINENQLSLYNNLTEQYVPLQLSEIRKDGEKLLSANVNFIANLPSSGRYSFTLLKNKETSKSIFDNPVKIIEGDSSAELSTRELRVRIPLSMTVGGVSAPAPILAISNDEQWLGNNVFTVEGDEIVNLTSSCIEKGSLFVKYEIKYQLKSGGSYQVVLTVVAGYPFVIVEEAMDSIPDEINARVEYLWTNFNPDYRFGSQQGRIKGANWGQVDAGVPQVYDMSPIYTPYVQEDPHWLGLGKVEKPEDELLHFLIPFAGNGSRYQAPKMSFWEEDGNELSVFVYDFNKWDDKTYGIWETSRKLAVTFHYRNKELCFHYPVRAGSRSTAISLMSRRNSVVLINEMLDKIEELHKTGGTRTKEMQFFGSHTILQSFYSVLNLNNVKDWQLTYGLSDKRPENPFNSPSFDISAEKYFKKITTEILPYYPLGMNSQAGGMNILHRDVYSYMVEGYLRHYRTLSHQQRQKVEALLLVSAYVNSHESMNAVRNSLAGCPNMAADGWSVPSQMAFLFPDHPMANEWLDQYEKTIEINGIYYTRPEVKQYESKGGRWAESLATYNWAYMRPTSSSNTVGILTDGKNRWANKYFAMRGRWMIDAVTAPVYNPKREIRSKLTQDELLALPIAPPNWKEGDDLSKENGFSRHYPAHGAHGGGVTVPPFIYTWQLANWLKYYDPITAENLYWLEGEEDFEVGREKTDWSLVSKKMYALENSGTTPHLKSSKYTGHGIVLRSGVGTNDEISIHLNQVDKGPNYRWGNQGQGGAGTLYFYAGGKIYTAHENEANGDFSQNNIDGVTNFGVMKNGSFTNIGPNVLSAPLYDLDVVQFGELLSDSTGLPYSWPEYHSRSALLVGTDYFLLYDKVGTVWRSPSRFSWFIAKDHEYPQIVFLTNQGRRQISVSETQSTRGFYRDNDRSSLVLVSPLGKKININEAQLVSIELLKDEPLFEIKKLGHFKYPEGVYSISTDSSDDLIFRDEKPIVYKDDNFSFDGTTGVIRELKSGEIELALIRGYSIGSHGTTFSFESNQIGWSAKILAQDEMEGKVKALEPNVLTLFSNKLKGQKFYLNGVEQRMRRVGQSVEIDIPTGEFYWELSNNGGKPVEPIIYRTVYSKFGVELFVNNPSGTNKLRFELSVDNGDTYKVLGETNKRNFFVSSENRPFKVHIRAIAIGNKKQSNPSIEYPVYFEKNSPHYPEGLSLQLDDNKVLLSWGEVLGVSSYKLYRRIKGEQKYDLVYEGLNREFIDNTSIGVVKSYVLPGVEQNKNIEQNQIVIYEYAISSCNGNGEGSLSPTVNTDPSSWLNWYPETDSKFKRQTSFWQPPYIKKEMMPKMYYPN